MVRALVGRFLERPIAASKLRKWNGFVFKNYTKRLNIRLAKTDLPRIIAAKTAVKFVIVDG